MELAASQHSYHRRVRVNSPAASKRSNKVKELVRRRVGGRWYKSRRGDPARVNSEPSNNELVRNCPGLRWYRVRRGDLDSKEIYEHRIWFMDTSLNLDGTGWKSQTDPENVSFVEHVKNHQLPDEFEADGIYNVMVEYLPSGTELSSGDLCSSTQEKEYNQKTESDDGGYSIDCLDYLSADNDEFREFRHKIWYKIEEEKLRKELADRD